MKWVDFWNYMTLNVWGSYTNSWERKFALEYWPLTMQGAVEIPEPPYNPYNLGSNYMSLAYQLYQAQSGKPKNAVSTKATGILYPTTRRQSSLTLLADGENGNLPKVFDKMKEGRFPNDESQLLNLFGTDMTNWDAGYYLIRVKYDDVLFPLQLLEAKIVIKNVLKEYKAGIKIDPKLYTLDDAANAVQSNSNRRYQYFSPAMLTMQNTMRMVDYQIRSIPTRMSANVIPFLEKAVDLEIDANTAIAFLWIHVDKDKQNNLRDTHIITQSYINPNPLDVELFAHETVPMKWPHKAARTAIRDDYFVADGEGAKKWDELSKERKEGDIFTREDNVALGTAEGAGDDYPDGIIEPEKMEGIRFVDNDGNELDYCGNTNLEGYVAGLGKSKIWDEDMNVRDNVYIDIEPNKNFFKPQIVASDVDLGTDAVIFPRSKEVKNEGTIEEEKIDARDDLPEEVHIFNIIKMAAIPRYYSQHSQTLMAGGSGMMTGYNHPLREVVDASQVAMGRHLSWNILDMSGNNQIVGIQAAGSMAGTASPSVKIMQNTEDTGREGVAINTSYAFETGVLDNDNWYVLPANQDVAKNESGKLDIYEVDPNFRSDWYFDAKGYNLGSIPASNFTPLINWNTGFTRRVWNMMEKYKSKSEFKVI